MISFHKEGSDLFSFETGSGATLYVNYIETKGRDLEEMIENAIITLETARGGEGPHWDLGDLPSGIFDAIVGMFAQRLRDEADARAEARSEDEPA